MPIAEQSAYLDGDHRPNKNSIRREVNSTYGFLPLFDRHFFL